jgi:hypothetical protein
VPYGVKKTPQGYKVYIKTTGKVLPGASATHAKAEKRITAINIHEHENRNGTSPIKKG